MREPILKSVAMPPKVLWAPMVPALANLAVQTPCVFFGIAIWDLNPLWIISTIIPVHIFLIIVGFKEPHLSNMLKSQGKFAKSYKSVYPEGGRKLAS